MATKFEIRLNVEPTGNSRGEPRWRWVVEGKFSDEKGWHTMSYRTGLVAETHGEVEDYGAKGIAYTKLGAMRVGHRAIKKIAKLNRHMAKPGSTTDGRT